MAFFPGRGKQGKTEPLRGRWLYALHGFIVVFFLSLPEVTPAQPFFSQYHLEHFSDETGLPSNDITGFVEDQRGNFWFSTQFGLVKFDGRTYRIFNTANLPTLSSNRIFALGCDSTGNIFFADENEIVHHIDSSGAISYCPQLAARKNFLMSRFGDVMDIRQQTKKREDSLVFVSPFMLHAWNNNLAHEFFVTGRNTAFFVVNKRLKYWDNGTIRELAAFPAIAPQCFMLNSRLFAIDAQGEIHAFDGGGELPARESMPALLAACGDKSPFDVKQAAVFSDGHQALLQYKDRIYAFQQSGEKLSLLLCLDKISLPMARGIRYSSRYNMYVVNTATDGIFLVKNKPFRVLLQNEGIALENNFLASVEIRRQTILTANGTLFLPNGQQQNLFRKGDIVNALLKDRKGRIWYAQLDSLLCADSNFRKIRSFYLPDTYVTGMAEDATGTIWCITNNSLMKLEGDSLRFLYERQEPLSRTECITFLNDSTAWLGTSKGLFSVHLPTGQYAPVREMKDKYIRHFYRAGDGKLWIGTYGNGFYCYDGTSFHNMPSDRNGYLSSAHCFVEDGRGFFWIPTNKGLFQVRAADLDAFVSGKSARVYYHYHDKTEGFLTNEFNGGCNPVGLTLSDGRISLPSMNGLVIFDPATILPNVPAAGLFIDDIWADTTHFNIAGELHFRPGQQNLLFKISTPFFGNAANLLVEYRIKNRDSLWKPVEDATIAINYLPAGKYILELRKLSGFGINNYTTISRAFTIAPFWYETNWFKFVAALFLVIGTYGVLRYRLRKLEDRKRALEELVQNRTEALENSVLQLKTTVAELQVSENNLYKSNLLKEKLTSVVLHDIRTPVHFIDLLSRQLQGSVSKNDRESLASLSGELTKTTGQLNLFTKEFLVWLVAQQTGFRIRKEYVLLEELFRDLNAFFQNMLEWNENLLTAEVANGVRVWTDRQLLRIILHNLIDNANKHTRNGKIELKASVHMNRLVLSVSDTGKGMPAHQLLKLQEGLSAHRIDSFGLDADGNLGFRIIKDFADRLDILVQVSSEEEKGTAVSLLFAEEAK